jgi:hypothetical protein
MPGLAPALRSLERLAAGDLDDAAAHLPRLQYALHVALERAHGLEPDGELAEALELARDTTAEVAEVLEREGAEAAAALLWEWRGALFTVRLARMRSADEGDSERFSLRPLAGSVVVVAAALLVLGGALASLWPVWMLGLALVAVSIALTHGQP